MAWIKFSRAIANNPRYDRKISADANLVGNQGACAQKKFTEETIKFIRRDRDLWFFRLPYWEFGKKLGDPDSGVIGDIIQAARKGGRKAVRYDMDETVEVYSIVKDPGETINLPDEKPELAEESYELFEKHKASDT